MSTQTTLRSQLQAIIESDEFSIRAAVASEALDYDNPADFFRNMALCGCAGGTVGSLIYISDTHAFFEQHYDEVEALREDWECNTGQPINIHGDLKNWLAWFAFEEVTHQMASELWLEV